MSSIHSSFMLCQGQIELFKRISGNSLRRKKECLRSQIELIDLSSLPFGNTQMAQDKSKAGFPIRCSLDGLGYNSQHAQPQ